METKNLINKLNDKYYLGKEIKLNEENKEYLLNYSINNNVCLIKITTKIKCSKNISDFLDVLNKAQTFCRYDYQKNKLICNVNMLVDCEPTAKSISNLLSTVIANFKMAINFVNGGNK